LPLGSRYSSFLVHGPVLSPVDPLLLPIGRAEAIHVERGSRFLAVIESATSIDDALKLRESRRRALHDATHHVWAVRLADGTTRYDDDGEPSGTGGRPILAAVEAAELVDTICVVTRYYGGTKLGTGGLARAYGHAAALSADLVPKRRVQRAEIRHVRYAFTDTGLVARALASHGAARDHDEFHDTVRTTIRIPVGTGTLLDRVLSDATQGRAILEECDAPEPGWLTLRA
jgi:putative IMPACT (imprinted ancient) family translation regulator